MYKVSLVFPVIWEIIQGGAVTGTSLMCVFYFFMGLLFILTLSQPLPSSNMADVSL